MFNIDMVLDITFKMTTPESVTIKTNATREGVEEILEAWLSCQRGQGKDESEPNARDVYKIKIQLDLSDDTFRTNSDVGNKSVTCGIILHIKENLDTAEILSLS